VIPSSLPQQGLVVFTMLERYLQAQSLVWVFVVGGVIVNIAVVIVCSIFIVAVDMDVIM
jgi:hypothetical protein